MTDLVERLRIKAGMIEMGERIAWGSDSALMREAADALEMAAPAVQGEPEDLRAAMLAVIDRNDWRTAANRAELRTLLAAAPAVQGEPVATIHVDGSFVHVAWRIPAPSRCAMDVYTAPQPAEQQPEPDSIREDAPYDDLEFEAVCREHEIWGTAAAAQCAVFWEAGKRVAEQKPAPDVAQLVEALEAIVSHHDEYFRGSSTESKMPWIGQARAALAPYRKGGEV